jgi:hypothetical protein
MRRDPRNGTDRLPRRGTDRLEDVAVWLLLLAGLLVGVLGLVIGIGVSGTAAARAHREAADRVAVQATALHDAPVTTAAPDAVWPRLLTDVSWTSADGAARTGPALVPAATRAGQAVTIWLDRAGSPVDEPDDASGAVLAGFAAGVIVLLAGGVVLSVAWLVVRISVATLNGHGWEREWARVGPEWTGHGGRYDAGRATD